MEATLANTNKVFNMVFGYPNTYEDYRNLYLLCNISIQYSFLRLAQNNWIVTIT